MNYTLDGYYEYDFNHPIGRVQYLRPYDVLSNVFSINQADLVFDWQPDVAERQALWDAAGLPVRTGDRDVAGQSCE